MELLHTSLAGRRAQVVSTIGGFTLESRAPSTELSTFWLDEGWERDGLVPRIRPGTSATNGVWRGYSACQKNPADAQTHPRRITAPQLQRLDAAARTFGITLVIRGIGMADELSAAFDAGIREGVGATLFTTAGFFVEHRQRIIELARIHKLPMLTSGQPVCAHFGHRDHSDRSIVISEIGGS